MKTSLQVIIVGLLTAAIGSYFVLSSDEKLPSDLLMTTLDQQKIKLSDYRGKTVLVNFWATSCTGCMQEMPELKKLQLKYGEEKFQTIAVAMDYDNIEYIKNYQKKENMPFKIVHDQNGEIAKNYGDITLTPTNFLINKEGKLIKKYVGIPNYNEIVNAIVK